jgi:dTDP-4-dehydrorhamnose 3,5-epimerase
MKLNVRSLPIADVKLIMTSRMVDNRGYFCEAYVRSDFAAHGLAHDFVQDNESSSDRAGTVRGLHFQKPPFAQAKLVRVLRGKIIDVVVDIRPSSPSFGKHLSVELSATGGEQLLVPRGFAHGFCTLEPHTTVLYKVDAMYSPMHDHGINWTDPGLAIEWPVSRDDAILSDKDRKLPMLRDLAPVLDELGGVL